MPDGYTFCLKCVNGYFYITDDNYLYKTDSNFNVISTYTSSASFYWGIYIHMYYDISTSLLYTISSNNHKIDVFNTNLAYVQSISLAGYSTPYSINKFNGLWYVGLSNSQVLVLQNNLISSVYTISSCSEIYSIILINMEI